MRKLLFFTSLFALCFAFSCSDDSSEDMEDDGSNNGGTLTGEIFGNEWTYKVGYAKQELDGRVVFELIGQDAEDTDDICDSFLTNKARIKFILPSDATGTYEQPRSPLTESVRFFPSSNDNGSTITAASGTVTVTEVNEDTIVCEMDVTGDDDHFAAGTFTVTKCF